METEAEGVNVRVKGEEGKEEGGGAKGREGGGGAGGRRGREKGDREKGDRKEAKKKVKEVK